MSWGFLLIFGMIFYHVYCSFDIEIHTFSWFLLLMSHSDISTSSVPGLAMLCSVCTILGRHVRSLQCWPWSTNLACIITSLICRLAHLYSQVSLCINLSLTSPTTLLLVTGIQNQNSIQNCINIFTTLMFLVDKGIHVITFAISQNKKGLLSLFLNTGLNIYCLSLSY